MYWKEQSMDNQAYRHAHLLKFTSRSKLSHLVRSVESGKTFCKSKQLCKGLEWGGYSLLMCRILCFWMNCSHPMDDAIFEGENTQRGYYIFPPISIIIHRVKCQDSRESTASRKLLDMCMFQSDRPSQPKSRDASVFPRNPGKFHHAAE